MGATKANLQLAGKSLLERVTTTMTRDCSQTVVVAAQGQVLPNLSSPCTIVRDNVAFEGPLGAILWGMIACESRIQRVFVASCDVPLLRPQCVELILNALDEHEIAIPAIDGRLHPLVAGYRIEVARTARDLFAAGVRRPIALLEHHRVRQIARQEFEAIDPNLQSFMNANTPEEFAALENLFHARLGANRNEQHDSA